MLLYNWLQDFASSKGGAKALIYRDTYLSWRGLLHRVDRRAAELEAAGVRAGDLVGLMLGNVPDFVILTLALSKIQAAPVPLDPTTSGRELEMVMASAPLRGLITRPRGGDAPLPGSGAPAPLPGRGNVRQKPVPESRRRLQGTLLSCSIFPTQAIPLTRSHEDRLAAVLITADSAGDPKAVDRTRGNLAAEAESVTRALELDGEDRVLLTVPLYHSFGFDIGFLAAVCAGAAIYLEDEVAPSRIVKLIREQAITLLPGSPTLFEAMAKLPASRPLAHRPLRFCSIGGGLAGAAADGFSVRYGARPLACYHTTETGTVSIDVKGQSSGSVGKPIEGVELRICHPKTGKPVASGRHGILWVRSRAVSKLRLQPVAVREGEVAVGARDAEGWYRAGDVANIDRGGRLHLHGREDDLVRVEGKRVALGEVEGCIESFPKVSAAQAMVITDPLGGPMVVARVVLKDKAKVDPEMIIDHCARQLSPYKVPRRIEFCKQL